MYIGLHVKYALFLPDFKETRIFLTDLRKCSNFMKIHLVGVELFRANEQRDGQAGGPMDGITKDGRTDRPDEVNIFFSLFCESAECGKNLICFSYLSIQNL
jgi:hypothetical protein